MVFPHATRAGPGISGPTGNVPSDGDRPLGSEIPPALHPTALLLAVGRFENSPTA